MPYTFTVDATPSLVRVHGGGTLSLEDVRMLLDDLVAAGVYAIPRLVDMSDATLHITATEVENVVATVARYRAEYGDVRVAVATHDPATFGMLRMYQLLSSKADPGFGVFYTLEEAHAWLS